jgi:hypothetical protein
MRSASAVGREAELMYAKFNRLASKMENNQQFCRIGNGNFSPAKELEVLM